LFDDASEGKRCCVALCSALVRSRATQFRRLFTAGPSSQCFLILLRLLERLVNAEARRLLPRWKLLESFEELPDNGLCRHEEKRAVRQPFPVEHVSVFARSLKWISPEVEHERSTQGHHRLSPDVHSVDSLFQEMDLPIFHPQSHQVPIVAPVKETLARVFLHITFQERQQVVAINVYLKGLLA